MHIFPRRTLTCRAPDIGTGVPELRAVTETGSAPRAGVRSLWLLGPSLGPRAGDVGPHLEFSAVRKVVRLVHFLVGVLGRKWQTWGCSCGWISVQGTQLLVFILCQQSWGLLVSVNQSWSIAIWLEVVYGLNAVLSRGTEIIADKGKKKKKKKTFSGNVTWKQNKMCNMMFSKIVVVAAGAGGACK